MALGSSTVAAGPLLRRVAQRIKPVTADAQTGRYSRITSHASAVSTAVGACAESETGTSRETVWRDELADSGVVTAVAWHPLGQPAPAPQTTRYARGELSGVIPGTVPADRVRLAAALDAVYPGEPVRRVEAIGELVTRHDTPLAARRAILQVLADVPGLVWHGRVYVDGRPGIGVSATSGADQYVLVIDETSGEIRAAEDVLVDPVIGRNMAVQTPFSMSRTVIASRGRTAVPG